MSKKSNNGRYLTLDNCRVFYNQKDNTISLTTTDEDMAGKPFRVTLNQGTESEQSLRELLTEQGVIGETFDHPQFGIPKFAPYPSPSEDHSSWNEFPLGVTTKKDSVSVDMAAGANALVCGRPGSGKSVLLRNFIRHASRHCDMWDVYGIDLRGIEFTELNKASFMEEVAVNVPNAIDMIRRVHEQMLVRQAVLDLLPRNDSFPKWSDVTAERGTEFMSESDLKLANHKSVLLVVEEVSLLLDATHSRNNSPSSSDYYRAEMVQRFADIVANGPEVGIYLLMSTQQLTNKSLGFLQHVHHRISLGATSVEDSESLFYNEMGTQVSDLQGRGMVRSFVNPLEDLSVGASKFFQLYYSDPSANAYEEQRLLTE